MTSTELNEIAGRLHVNPYFIAYVIETKGKSVKETWRRDRGGYKYFCWLSERWADTCRRLNLKTNAYKMEELHSNNMDTLSKRLTGFGY